jgi:hypothetical protein
VRWKRGFDASKVRHGPAVCSASILLIERAGPRIQGQDYSKLKEPEDETLGLWSYS